MTADTDVRLSRRKFIQGIVAIRIPCGRSWRTAFQNLVPLPGLRPDSHGDDARRRVDARLTS